MIIQTVCPTCFGLGIVARSEKKCNMCCGSGEVIYDDVDKCVLPIALIPQRYQNEGFYEWLNRSIHSLPEIDEELIV